MGKFFAVLSLLLFSACAAPLASTGSGGTTSPDQAFMAEGLDHEVIDLNLDFAQGRPVALVFWQAW